MSIEKSCWNFDKELHQTYRLIWGDFTSLLVFQSMNMVALAFILSVYNIHWMPTKRKPKLRIVLDSLSLSEVRQSYYNFIVY